ncbi:hypothetical protein WMY93_023475 [Mugilogobius chulae]|uniref:Membrane protein FAM174B n=1 Tax=Mugilogobius chulae TaxID=88201 RepID=A0AAW0NGJ3_9GOBI
MSTKTHIVTLVLVACTWCVNAQMAALGAPFALNIQPLHWLGLENASSAHNGTVVGARTSVYTVYMPLVKLAVGLACLITGVLLVILLVRLIRSGRRIQKTRKYDIITTPGERVEMAPLNQDQEEEDDSTLFDVKYR